MSAARIPLLVLGGFLGAGKTSLLNHLLAHAGGRRWVALVNDFGAVNIDAGLIARQGADMLELTNGCVCCSLGDDLSAALIRVLAMAPRPAAIVIEASGISDPWRIAQIGLADPELSLDGVLVLVDASAVLEHAADPLLGDSLSRQLRHADLVVINKADLVDDARLARVHAWLDTQGVAGRRVQTTQGLLPMALLSSEALQRLERHDAVGGATRPHALCAHEGCAHDGHDHDHPHTDLYETWSCHPTRDFSTQELRSWLKNLPEGVLRLKGWVRTEDSAWTELQFAGRRESLRAATQDPERAVVVVIALRGRLPGPDWRDFLASGTA